MDKYQEDTKGVNVNRRAQRNAITLHVRKHMMKTINLPGGQDCQDHCTLSYCPIKESHMEETYPTWGITLPGPLHIWILSDGAADTMYICI